MYFCFILESRHCYRNRCYSGNIIKSILGQTPTTSIDLVGMSFYRFMFHVSCYTHTTCQASSSWPIVWGPRFVRIALYADVYLPYSWTTLLITTEMILQEPHISCIWYSSNVIFAMTYCFPNYQFVMFRIFIFIDTRLRKTKPCEASSFFMCKNLDYIYESYSIWYTINFMYFTIFRHKLLNFTNQKITDYTFRNVFFCKK